MAGYLSVQLNMAKPKCEHRVEKDLLKYQRKHRTIRTFKMQQNFVVT